MAYTVETTSRFDKQFRKLDHFTAHNEIMDYQTFGAL